jgi:hypothetical protein
LGLLVELGQGELEELVHLLGIAFLASEDLCEDAATGTLRAVRVDVIVIGGL